VDFTLDSLVISEISNRSKVAVGVVDHPSRLYDFSHFIPKYPSYVLLLHVNEFNSSLHEMVVHLKIVNNFLI